MIYIYMKYLNIYEIYIYIDMICIYYLYRTHIFLLLFDIVFLCIFFLSTELIEETKISGESDVRGDIRRESLESRWRNSRVLIGVDGRSPAPVC